MPGDDEPLLFDEDFVESAAFTEPSARERAKRPGRLSRRRAARRSPDRGSGWKTALTVTVVVAVLALVATFAWKGRHSRTPAPETLPDPRHPAPTVNAADPFTGSPAVSYLDGVMGITSPTAAPIGGLSTHEVESAYATVRARLAAAALDRPTLLGGAPDAFARTLSADERSSFTRDLDDPDPARRTRSWVVSFAPRTTELAGPVIKVHGGMSARPTADEHVKGMTVRFDYLFVYAVRRPGEPSTLERLVARVTGEVFFHRADGALRTYISRWGVSPTPARCDVDDGFIHPTYAGSTPESSPATGPRTDPYDLSHALPDDGMCHRSKGT
jgi:hypothetical protein